MLTLNLPAPAFQLSTLQQQASLALLPLEGAAAPPAPSSTSRRSSSADLEDLIEPEAIDAAWVRRVGRLSEGQALEGVTQLALEAVDAPALGGVDGLGSLLPSLEVTSPLEIVYVPKIASYFSQTFDIQTLSFALGSRLNSLRHLGTGLGQTLLSLDVTGWCVA